MFLAMEDLIRYLLQNLPQEFIQALSDVMMPDLSARLREFWLDTAVPSSLDDLLEYQKSLMQVHQFITTLKSVSWPGSGIFQSWVDDSAKIWISKRRETALDWIRIQLEFGKTFLPFLPDLSPSDKRFSAPDAGQINANIRVFQVSVSLNVQNTLNAKWLARTKGNKLRPLPMW